MRPLKQLPTRKVSGGAAQSVMISGRLGDRLRRAPLGSRLAGVVFAAAVLAVVPMFVSTTNLTVATEIGELSLVAIGLVALHGYSGQLSLGQGAFMALTGYTMAHMADRFHWPALAGVALGLVLCVVVATIMGVVLLRMRGLYLALATLAFADIVQTIASGWTKVTGGPSGQLAPSISFGGYAISTPLRQYVLAWVVVAAVGIMLHRFAGSPRGRALRAVGRDEVMAGSLGVPVVRYKVMAFVMSAALAGIAGALYAATLQFLSPGLVGYQESLQLFVMHVLGGVGSIFGAVIGVGILQAVPQIAPSAQRYQLLIDGCVLLAVLRFFPTGLVPGAAGLVSRLTPTSRARGASKRKVAEHLEEPDTPDSSTSRGCDDTRPAAGLLLPPRNPGEKPGDLLNMEDVTKSFEGIQVLRGVTCAVLAGSITAVIGPNGAGKTTLLNVITGVVSADRGTLAFQGEQMQQPLPHKAARAGIVRTFQTPRLDLTRSVVENVLTGACALSPPSLSGALLGLPSYRRRERDDARLARQLVGLVGLAGWEDRSAGQLPLGHQRRLEIARALMSRPSLLVVDEPAAGSNDQERQQLADVFKSINQSGYTVLLVEHNMDLVMSISDRVIVLDQGRVIGSGSPDEVRRTTAVIQAYLGLERSADAGTDGATVGGDNAGS